jgi:hypothetical protein
MAGADIAAVQHILRHSDPRITMSTYAHLAPGYLQDQVNRLSFGAPAESGALSESDTAKPADTGPPGGFAAGLLLAPAPDAERAGPSPGNLAESGPFVESRGQDLNLRPSGYEGRAGR